MDIINVDSNIIFNLGNIDLRMIDQIWLVEKKICEREDFSDPQTLLLPDLKQIVTPTYTLIFSLNRISLSVKGSQDEKFNIMKNKITAILKEQQLISFDAMGINFLYDISSDGDFGTINHKLFFKKDFPISTYFESSNSRYGAFMSTDYQGLRLKLEIRPITAANDLKEKHRLQFNYHLDLKKIDSVRSINEHITKWMDYNNHTLKIVETFNDKMENETCLHI